MTTASHPTSPDTSQGRSTSAAGASAKPIVLSPHLQIWKFTVTMAASITHRGCGVALYTGSALLALWLYATAFDPGLYGFLSGILSSWFGIVIFAGYSFALFFHMANGVRHLFWDAGHGLDIDTARRTAWIAFIGAALLMLIVVGTGLSIAGRV